MDRISSANHVLVDGIRKFTDTPPATAISADWLNAIQEELMAVLSQGGIAPSALQLTQVRDAIINLIRNTDIYVVDTGAADAYVITPTPAFTSYVAGLLIWFKAANANTGSSTLNVNGLGVKSITKNGGADYLELGDIVVGQICGCIFDGTNFQLISNYQISVADIPQAAFKPTTYAQPVRTLTTVYQNASTYPLHVAVIFHGGGGADAANLFLGAGNPPGDLVQKFTVPALEYVTLDLIVPAGYYWKATVDAAQASITSTTEWYV